MLIASAIILAVYIAFLLLMYLGQRHLMYHPTPLEGSPATHGIPELDDLKLINQDGELITSWVKFPNENQFIIIYFHGNAGSIVDRISKVRPYLQVGFGLLLTGYRGYGGNRGNPTEPGLYNDAAIALQHLEDLGIPPNRWVLYGESLGTGIATEMAHRYANKKTPVNSLILEAPFTSMGDAAAKHYPFLPARLLVRDKYDSISKIAKINTRLLVVHGNEDQTIPQKLGRRLFDAAKEPKLSIWIDRAGHNNLYDFGASDHIIQFITLNKS